MTTMGEVISNPATPTDAPAPKDIDFDIIKLGSIFIHCSKSQVFHWFYICADVNRRRIFRLPLAFFYS